MYASLLMKLTAFLRKVYVSNFLMLIPILLYNDQVIRIINRFPIQCNIHKHENVEIDIGYKMIRIASKYDQSDACVIFRFVPTIHFLANT